MSSRTQRRINKVLIMVALSAPLQFLSLIPGGPQPSHALTTIRMVTSNPPTAWLDRRAPRTSQVDLTN